MDSSPKWWQLYALFLVPVILLVVQQQLPLSSGDHEAAQIAIILLTYGLIQLWLIANTAALAEADKEQDRRQIMIEKFYPSGLPAASSADGNEENEDEEAMAGIASGNGSSPVVKMTDVRYDDSSYPSPTSPSLGGADLVDLDNCGDLSFNRDDDSTSGISLAGQR